MKKNNISGVIETGKENFQFNKLCEKILKMELKKILLTYCAEFPTLVNKEKIQDLLNTKLKIYLSEKIDAHGFYQTVEFSSGSSKFLNDLNKLYK